MRPDCSRCRDFAVSAVAPVMSLCRSWVCAGQAPARSSAVLLPNIIMEVTLPQKGSFQSHLWMHCQGSEAVLLLLLQVTTNRGLILKTLETKGPEYAGEMGLQNVRDLLPIIQWNYENGVRLFRRAEGRLSAAAAGRLSPMCCLAGW